ncbi:LysR family transcriptional regulator [Rhodococcus sp. NPDC003348]
MDLRKLEQFAEVARCGSFHRAAETLHMSQPALSRSIQSLERQYGVRLLERGRDGVLITEVGRQVLASADTLLRGAEELKNVMRSAAAGLAGEISFGISPSSASNLLPRLMTEVVRDHPELSVRITIDSVDALTEALFAGSVEVFLALAHPAHSLDRLRVDRLGPSRVEFSVREGHPLDTGNPVPVEALRDYPVVAVTAWNGYLNSLPVRFDRSLLRASIELDNYELLTSTVLATDAVLVGSGWTPGRGLALLAFSEDLGIPETEAAMYSLRSRTRSPLVDALVDWVRAVR